MPRFMFNDADFGEIEQLSDLDDDFIKKIKSNLTAPQMFCLRVTGSFKIGYMQMKGWSTELPFYIFYCEKHSLQITYPTGHLNKVQCPECVKERASKTKCYLRARASDTDDIECAPQVEVKKLGKQNNSSST